MASGAVQCVSVGCDARLLQLFASLGALTLRGSAAADRCRVCCGCAAGDETPTVTTSMGASSSRCGDRRVCAEQAVTTRCVTSSRPTHAITQREPT